jgi:hypothetical protein
MTHKVPTEQVSPYELAVISGGKPDQSFTPTVQTSGVRPPPRGPPPSDAAICYRISDAVAISGLSRSTLYKAMQNGHLRSVFVAGRRLIPAAVLRRFLLGAA